MNRHSLLWLALLASPAFAGDLGSTEASGSLEEALAGGEEEVDALPPIGWMPAVSPIINGEAAPIDLFPHTGGLLVRLDENGQEGVVLMCSSTLIAPDVVMIAAHCVDPVGLCLDSSANCVAEVGWSRKPDLAAYTSLSESWPSDIVMATDWVMDDQWDYYSLAYGLADNNDIALVFLSEPVLDVTPALLPTIAEADEIAQGDEVSIVGWGYQDSELTGELGIKMWGVSDISNLNTFEMQIGAAYESVRKCHGDSGGPTFRDYPDSDSEIKERVIGVTSHSYDSTDCTTTGGVDTRVDHHLTFIASEMVSRCQAGTRVWCETEGIIQPPIVPKTLDELTSDIHLVGCATGGSRAGLWGALLAFGLTLGRRYRPVPRNR